MFAHNSTTESRRNIEICTTVVHATADIPHQFEGQKSMVKVTKSRNAVTEN